MLTAICHQVPSATVVMHHLGLFYFWQLFDRIPGPWLGGHIVCK